MTAATVWFAFGVASVQLHVDYVDYYFVVIMRPKGFLDGD